MKPEQILAFFDRWETVPLALATKFGPWLTPLVPALFVQRALVARLQTPPGWGWLAAITLEVVGIAATNSLLRAYTWERERRKSDPAAPLRWHVLAAAVYYATAFLLVLVMEFFPAAARLAPAMFVLLAGTSALVLALAGDQKRRENLTVKLSEKRSARRSASRSDNTRSPVNFGQFGHSDGQSDPLARANLTRRLSKSDAETRLRQFMADHPHASHAEAARAVGRSRSWVSTTLAQWKTLNGNQSFPQEETHAF